jgi:tripartite-type tricarboxylate transporter receptor subunit TctC
MLIRSTLAVLTAATLLGAAAQAQDGVKDFPSKPIRLVVGFAAGGIADLGARLLGDHITRETGQPVVVENRTAAAGTIAALTVAKAPADGYTLGLVLSGQLVINPFVQKQMPFDVLKELVPVAALGEAPQMIAINAEVPAKTLKELIALAKAKPGSLNYGSAGYGSLPHLSAAEFVRQAGIEMVHVPYKGNAPAMTDVIGGQIGMMFDIVSTARGYVASGRVRALAVTSRERNPSLPDVPTMREAGLPNFEVVGWFGLYAPPKLAPALVGRYAEAARKALASDELKVLWNEHGYDRWPGSAETMAAQASRERAMWGTVTKGINVE